MHDLYATLHIFQIVWPDAFWAVGIVSTPKAVLKEITNQCTQLHIS